MRRGWVWAACMLLVGCGGGTAPGTAADWTAQADQAFAEGDRLAQTADGMPDAVAAWRRAGSAYVKAFRLEDPTPERGDARALLAFRIGRAWSKAARESLDEKRRGPHADRALFWFAHARRLKSDLRPTSFERAVLFDSDIADVADKLRARESYQAYVDGFRDAESISAGDEQRLAIARERLKVLTAGD